MMLWRTGGGAVPYHNAVHELLGLALLPERLEGGDPRREEAVAERRQRAAEDAEPQPEAEQDRQREEHGQFQARVDAVSPG